MKEHFVAFRSREEFLTWWSAHPEISDKAYIRKLVSRGRARGLHVPYVGDARPKDVAIIDENYRETYLAFSTNSRHRSLLAALHATIGDRPVDDAVIYAHEALTPFAMILRRNFVKFCGSEYAPDPADQARIFPIPHVDASATPFPSGVFDVVLSSDVLEHVADIPAVLRETRRILKPGAAFLATFPFAYGNAQTTVKATLRNGKIEYLTEPEYHGDPVRPEEGALVFAIPGWDIIEQGRDAGFSDVSMIFDSSSSRGCTGSELAGIFLYKAVA